MPFDMTCLCEAVRERFGIGRAAGFRALFPHLLRSVDVSAEPADVGDSGVRGDARPEIDHVLVGEHGALDVA